jgi:hypothetical protein
MITCTDDAHSSLVSAGSCTRRSLLATLSLGLAMPIAWGQEKTLSQRPMREGFGLNVKFIQGQPEEQIDLLPRLGVNWVRDTVMWPTVEPRPGEYRPFPLPFQTRLKKYRDMGIGIVFMLAYTNSAAYPKTSHNPLAPIDPKAFGRYAAYVAAQLEKAGVRFALEVWNEPHNFHIREMVGGNWNGRPPSPWVDHYIEMVREVFEQARKVAPDVSVMTSEDVWSNHYWFARHPRLPDGFCDIGLHPYTNDSATGPEVAAPYPNTDWGKPFQMVDNGRAFESAVRRLRDYTQRHTGHRPNLWLTEWGWRINEKFSGGTVTESLASAFLPRAFIISEAIGSKALLWFSMYDAKDGAFGLLDMQGKPRATFKAFEAMNHLIGDYVLSTRLTPAERPTTGLQAYLLKKGQLQRIVVWSADNLDREFTLDSSWQVSDVHDVYGTLVKAQEPFKQIQIGAAPVYLQLKSTAPVRWSEKLAK